MQAATRTGVFLLVGLLVIAGVILYVGGTFSTVQQQQPTPQQQTVQAGCEDTVVATLSIQDKYNTNANITDANGFASCRVLSKQGDGTYVKGIWKTAASGTVITGVNYLDKVECVGAIAGTPGTAVAYTEHKTFDVSRCGQNTFTLVGANDIVNTSVVAEFWDDSGNLQSADCNNGAEQNDIDVGVGETLHFTYTGTSKVDYGNQFETSTPNVLCFRHNNTAWQPSLFTLTLNGVSMTRASAAPQKAAAVANTAVTCWKVPPITSTTTQDYRMYVMPSTSAGQGPITSSDFNNTIFMADGNYYIDQNTNEVVFGVESENFAEIGAANDLSQRYCTTAD